MALPTLALVTYQQHIDAFGAENIANASGLAESLVEAIAEGMHIPTVEQAAAIDAAIAELIEAEHTPEPDWCPECEGDAYFLGKLGKLHWFRCRDCGAEWDEEV